MMSWRSYKTEKLVGGLNVFGKITVCLKFKMSLIITICEGFSCPYWMSRIQWCGKNRQTECSKCLLSISITICGDFSCSYCGAEYTDVGRTARQRVQNIFDNYNLQRFCEGLSCPYWVSRIQWCGKNHQTESSKCLWLLQSVKVFVKVFPAPATLAGYSDAGRTTDTEFKMSLIITIWWGFPCPN